MPSLEQEVYLSELPKISIQRSIFDRPQKHLTSFNVGDLIPVYLDEVIPGSTHQVKTTVVARLQTLLTPIMDDLFLDVRFFFVPNRLTDDHWPQICGENDKGPWTRDKVNYKVPYLQYPLPVYDLESGDLLTPGGFAPGSIADYFGVPVDVYVPDTYASGSGNVDTGCCPSALPFRAYSLIVNEFYRSTPLQHPIVTHTDDTIRRGVRSRTSVPDPNGVLPDSLWYITDLELGGKPFKVSRFHDYFSSALPQPQASEPVSIFGGFTNDDSTNPFASGRLGPFAPVVTGKPFATSSTDDITLKPLQFIKTASDANADLSADSILQSNTNWFVGRSTPQTYGIVPSNLYASLNIPEATISTLRLAFQMQKYFERLGSGGQRYREYLSAFFGVDNGDARLQIPEYLGGKRIPLSIHQVANTSQSDDGDLGDLGAMSNTSDSDYSFEKSFTEWGYIIGLACVRYDNTYSQGLEPLWSRRDILQFYNPVFANISDQPIYRREIFTDYQTDAGGNPTGPLPWEVFGYKPAWQEYRQKFNRCSGEMRPEVSNSLASWHLGDYYTSAPYLSEEWIMTDENIVDRVLAVGHEVSNQVFADFFFENRTTQPMPMFAIPGLADHF